MILIFPPLLLGAAIASAVLDHTQDFNTVTMEPISNTLHIRQTDACQLGAKNVILDARSLNQTIKWEIGELKASGGEKFCKTTMAMESALNWQYAVTSIEWTSHIVTADNTQALIQLNYNFQNNLKVSRFRWSFDGGKDEQWNTHMAINPVVFSTCGVQQPLIFEWRVAFNLNKGKGGSGAVDGFVGDSRRDGHLLLKLGTTWRQCT